MPEDSVRIPGIGRVNSLRLYKKYDRDYLAMYRHLHQRLGDLFYLYLPTKRFVICNPELIGDCLRHRHGAMTKSVDYKKLRPLMGQGLLTSDGDLWRRERRVFSAGFSPGQLRLWHEQVFSRVALLVKKWANSASPSLVVDVSSEMTDLAVVIAGDLFIGEDLGSDAASIRESIGVLTAELALRIVSFVNFPLWLPTASNRRFRDAIRTMDRIVYRMIERKMRDASSDDVISRIIVIARESNEKLDHRLLRDEIVTLLSAGHETTALAVSWGLDLLARNQMVQDEIAAEASPVMNLDSCPHDVLGKLRVTEMTSKEILRLCPAIPAISRRLQEDLSLGPYQLRKGALLTFPAGICHRDERWWKRPGEFDPYRFANAEKIDESAYFPFGLGPRRCIGERLAHLEMILILALICREFVLEPIEPRPSEIAQVTLRPRTPIKVVLRRRTTSIAGATNRETKVINY